MSYYRPQPDELEHRQNPAALSRVQAGRAVDVVAQALHGDAGPLAGLAASRDPDRLTRALYAALAVARTLAGQFPDPTEAINFAAEQVDELAAGEAA
ncbi:hypothetical protein [Pseudonocardia acidicola]|uniref:Uncharacterized protein n=1 Tax=Pseudonocardia acidicola TaxID=2724939 RepID=A0ABX1SGM9_9PSEU|nr:hypothetical protein [Pseudonocardia acidicola]NMI00722.1 hypothetical protein [Pseudonocardia acidicola]